MRNEDEDENAGRKMKTYFDHEWLELSSSSSSSMVREESGPKGSEEEEKKEKVNGKEQK